MKKRDIAIYTGCFLLGCCGGNRIEGREEYIEGFDDVAKMVRAEQDEVEQYCNQGRTGQRNITEDYNVSFIMCGRLDTLYDRLYDDINLAAMDALRDEDGI